MTAPVADVATDSWIFTGEYGHHALAIVTDIDAFTSTLDDCFDNAKSKRLRQHLMGIVDLIEFAPVTMKKNGTVQWKNGHFAPVEGSADEQ